MNQSPLLGDDDKKCTIRRIAYISVITTLCVAAFIVILVGVLLPSKEMRFIMINDIHVDPKYKNDSIADYNTYCRASNGSKIPRPFGQYICDTPNVTFESLCNFLPKVEKNPAFIVFGGDSLGHSLGPSREQISGAIQYLLNKMTASYPNIPVLFTIGNNDLIPNYGNFTNDPDDFASLAEIFKKYMNTEQYDTFKKGGFYYHDIPSQKLRILLLNNIIYHWRHGAYDPQNPDPYNQFAWIKNVTQDAVNKKMKVGIVMHTPTGVAHDDYQPNYHTEYIKTFYDTIKPFNYEFILVSHTHKDQFIPIWKAETELYSLCAPAVTPAHLNNPGFRIYTLKGGSMFNYHQYFADISTNPQNDLDWRLEYDFNSLYGVTGVSMENIRAVVKKLTNDVVEFWKYRETLFAKASLDISFYKCILTAVTAEEAHECRDGLNSIRTTINPNWYDE